MTLRNQGIQNASNYQTDKGNKRKRYDTAKSIKIAGSRGESRSRVIEDIDGEKNKRYAVVVGDQK